MFTIDTASAPLARIMRNEDSRAWEPYGDNGARIELPDGSLLVVDQQRIAEAAEEIRSGWPGGRSWSRTGR
jgi:hypothetical protein